MNTHVRGVSKTEVKYLATEETYILIMTREERSVLQGQGVIDCETFIMSWCHLQAIL